MRALIFASLGLAIGAAFLHAAPAKAQEPGYAWCLEESTRGEGSIRNCGFATHAQCIASRSTPAGSNCYRNPASSSYAEEPRPRLRRVRDR